MAASSKPTGIHVALIISLLISIACGVGWVMAYKGAGSISELRKERDDAKEKLKTAETQFRNKDEDLKRLKDALGMLFEDVGADGSNANTVLGDIKNLMAVYGHGVVDPTLKQTMIKLSQQMRDTATSRDSLQQRLAVEIAEYEQKLSEAKTEVAKETKAREDTYKDKSNSDKTHQEEIAKKDADIAEYKKNYDELRVEYDERKDADTKRIAEQEKRITALIAINKRIAQELDDRTRPSFEKPSGQIRFVDSVAKKVFIDIGEADGLRPRTTFSVYKKQHSGVGRGTVKGTVGGEDIKASIEVTRVMEAHLSEARILTEDIYHPIMKGDPIYSPLWSAAHDEAFSFVGIVDLDGDKKHDRDTLHEIVATAGGVIDNEVTPEGVLIVNGKEVDADGKPVVTEHTKFLVIARIPEISDTADPEEIQKILKIQGYRKDLEDAARERGVRVVSLSDFLNYIGHKQQRRLFQPGSDVPYNLKSGSHSTAVGESSGSKRVSSGQTSGAYSGDKAVRPKTTGDGTTKAFRGGK
jgi:hypothetical protein